MLTNFDVMPSYRYERFRPSLPMDIPGTNFIILANLLSFVLIFLRLFPREIYELFVSTSQTVWKAPWTFFTYPLISRPLDAWKFISLLFALWWLFVVGGLLERSWGTKKFLIAFFTFSAISAFFISLGAMILNIEVGFGELICPLVDLTVIWAMLEPNTPVILFVFPMQLRWLALITCFMLLFQFGNPYPFLGFSSLGGCAAAYLYTKYLRHSSEGSETRSSYKSSKSSKPWSWLNPFEWYRRWKFKRKFRRLWGE